MAKNTSTTLVAVTLAALASSCAWNSEFKKLEGKYNTNVPDNLKTELADIKAMKSPEAAEAVKLFEARLAEQQREITIGIQTTENLQSTTKKETKQFLEMKQQFPGVKAQLDKLQAGLGKVRRGFEQNSYRDDRSRELYEFGFAPFHGKVYASYRKATLQAQLDYATDFDKREKAYATAKAVFETQQSTLLSLQYKVETAWASVRQGFRDNFADEEAEKKWLMWFTKTEQDRDALWNTWRENARAAATGTYTTIERLDAMSTATGTYLTGFKAIHAVGGPP